MPQSSPSQPKKPDRFGSAPYRSVPLYYRRLAGVCQEVWNPRRCRETDAQYLLRVVRDVRNNLFHGGKYPASYGSVEEIARDGTLVDAATTVLERCLVLHDKVRAAFEEEAA